MKTYRRITRQFGTSYMFTFLIILVSMVCVPLLTRNISVSEYGVFSLLSSAVAILTTVLAFGVVPYMTTHMPTFDRLKRAKAFNSILIFQFLVAAPLLVLAFFPQAASFAASLLKIAGYGLCVQITALILFFSLVFEITNNYLYAERKIEFMYFAAFLNKAGWAIILVGIYAFFKGFSLQTVLWLWLGSVLASMIVQAVYMRRDFERFSLRIHRETLERALHFGLPLMFAVAGAWVITSADRYMINYFGNPAQVGVYSLAYSLSLLILSSTAIIPSVLYPYIVKALHANRNHMMLFNATLKYSLMVCLPAMVGMFVLREQIITLVSGVEYLSGSAALAILVFFPLFASLTTINFNQLVMQKRTKAASLIFVVGAALNLALNLWAIPRYGIEGAAATTLLAYVFTFIATQKLATLEYDWSFLRVDRVLAASLIMGMVVHLIDPQVFPAKIATMGIGAVVYCALLFFLRAFVKQEYQIMASFLPGPLKGIFKRIS